MKRDVTKRIVRYYVETGLIGLAIIGVFMTIMIYVNPFLAAIILSVLLFVYSYIVNFIATKRIFSVLYDEIDLRKFELIANKKVFRLPHTQRMNYAYFAGDYQTAVDIATAYLKRNAPIGLKYRCLVILARVYFEVGDFEKLKLVCDKFEEMLASAKKQYEKVNYPIMQYYRHYLMGDFSSCIKLYEGNLPKAQNRIQQIIPYFSYAIALYKQGDFEKAMQNFNRVITEAPQLNIAHLSENYLRIMKDSSASMPVFPEILPQSYAGLNQKSAKIKRIILWTILLVGVITLTCLMSLQEENNYDSKENTLSLNDTDYKIIDCVSVIKDNVTLTMVYVMEDSAGNIDVGYAEGDQEFLLYVDNMKNDIQIIDWYQYDNENGYAVGYFLTSKEEQGDSLKNIYKKIEFKQQGQTKYFYITCTNKINNAG